MHRPVPDAETKSLREKPLYVDADHFVARSLARAPFDKVQQAVSDGTIVQIGRVKYRAVLPWKGRLLFVVFTDEGDYLEAKTVGITGRWKERWD